MKLLDLFCGAGGASMGYHLAGFDVAGVDIQPQAHYPFAFHQGDALEFLQAHGREFDVIHASPPCQGYTQLKYLPQLAGNVYPMLIEETRALLKQTGKPYIIENVSGAPLDNPIELEGRLFGLKVLRRRLFESNLFFLAPELPILRRNKRLVAPLSEFDRGQYGFIGVYGQRFELSAARSAMGIDWMNRAELAQAIPPAYTYFLGRELIRRFL